jgi:hypothetical protein
VATFRVAFSLPFGAMGPAGAVYSIKASNGIDAMAKGIDKMLKHRPRGFGSGALFHGATIETTPVGGGIAETVRHRWDSRRDPEGAYPYPLKSWEIAERTPRRT